VASFNCSPTGGATGLCESACQCSGPTAKEGAQLCQELRRSCQENCRAAGLSSSIRCSPPEGTGQCTCS
jgi:hypothetical protein